MQGLPTPERPVMFDPSADVPIPATPEPVGEPVYMTASAFVDGQPYTWREVSKALYDSQPEKWRRILYTRPAPGAPDFAALLKVKEPDGCAADLEEARRQEARCDGWNDCRDEVLSLLAAQAKQ